MSEIKCSVCRMIGNAPPLAELIDTTDNLKALATELEIPYINLYRHAKNHQGKLQKTEPQLPEKPKKDYVDLWDTVIEKGLRRVKNEDIKVSLPLLLKAAKDKADYEAKQDDQSLEAAKLMYEFASGERTDVIEGEVVESRNSAPDSGGETGPSGIHHEAPGHALASGPDNLP